MCCRGSADRLRLPAAAGSGSLRASLGSRPGNRADLAALGVALNSDGVSRCRKAGSATAQHGADDVGWPAAILPRDAKRDRSCLSGRGGSFARCLF